MTTERLKKETLHRAVPFFEDAPCYETSKLVELFGLNQRLAGAREDAQIEEAAGQMNALMDGLTPIANAPARIYLWKEGNMPSLGTYTDNAELQNTHDPDFLPYMYEMLVPEDVTPKGAIIVCAGAAHGDCTLHEGFQTSKDLVAQGYQCFILLNRPNHCPYDAKEAGADASRAIRMVRGAAKRYRIDENRVAFAGCSNGGITAEACVQYFSGTQKITTHFPDYVPDEYDHYYGAPDAILCIYGPRFKDAKFDYTNVVYPPTFFAVGKDDFAMNNLLATYPDLMEHHVDVEIHTFSGVPHGQSGVTIYGNYSYPNFNLWPQLADTFLQKVFAKSVIKHRPDELHDEAYRYDAFDNHKVLLEKKKNHLPPMGWNSWNAFGSGNTEALTKAMAEKMVELGLDKLGYQYLVLDDGCYKPTRVDGKLSNEERKFPNGFKALSDFVHGKGLKFGMYNDIGTNLCAGAAVGTCGHEATDAQSYVEWGVDFLKVDNCYYLWDNATFSDAANAKYVFAPNLKGIRVAGQGLDLALDAVKDGALRGAGAEKKETYVTGIGTFDGTGPWATPVGPMSGELVFKVQAPQAGNYDLFVTYATGMENGVGSWLQVAVGEGEQSSLCYDDFLPASESTETFVESAALKISLQAGENVIRLMNHRRQENTLSSYAALLEGLNAAAPNHDIIFSICEWGKTQPQNWGYKVGDCWRILNDITFRVGADGDWGHGTWKDDYTPSVTSQYNKAVIMDEFAGLDKGWNDPDMLMVGMNGLTDNMAKTHMTMWCMMNSPLMLGLDLRRVTKGDALYQMIANEGLIALNQDALGIAAKRIFCSLADKNPDTEYVRDINRVDILAKPLSDGSVALSFINVSEEDTAENYSVTAKTIVEFIGHKLVNKERFAEATSFKVVDLWTGKESLSDGTFAVKGLAACDNVTIRVTPIA